MLATERYAQAVYTWVGEKKNQTKLSRGTVVPRYYYRDSRQSHHLMYKLFLKVYRILATRKTCNTPPRHEIPSCLPLDNRESSKNTERRIHGRNLVRRFVPIITIFRICEVLRMEVLERRSFQSNNLLIVLGEKNRLRKKMVSGGGVRHLACQGTVYLL